MRKMYKVRPFRKPKTPALAQLLANWRRTAREYNDIDEVAQETEGST